MLPLPAGTDPGIDPEIARLQAQPLPEGTALVVRTSGSSGIPKAVALSAAALRASAAATHERLGGGRSADGADPAGSDDGADPAGSGGGQWLVALPGHLISGLQMLVRSRLAGTDPVFVDGPFDPAALLAAADRMQHPRRYVSLVPVQLARLLDLAEADPAAADALRGFAGVLVGGQATPLPLRQRAHELGVALRRSYGMTETAGGCVYDGVEIGDTRIRIRRSETGAGEVQIAGPCLALGYVGDPELTAERFIEERDRDGVVTRWYRTGDAGELLGGMLTVTGRVDRVVISGGVNVSLDEVERVARELPGWTSAVALGSAHPEWGERVALAVETEPGAAGFEEVREAIRSRLGPAAAPVWATETEELPRLPGGKPDLPAIEAWLRTLRASFDQLRES
ncbi:putative 2-succinylbenzoate--CoA ligase [Leucobacter soli]|uniref:2-succinylbenzoate--CoA ligase n=1 Tax=Leucobacter soli TaxID=2812850 RepID=A0A916JYC2_9MICO|nr:putative 2-succinylbenzoate--CoA ligase [Leucobacter soli]